MSLIDLGDLGSSEPARRPRPHPSVAGRRRWLSIVVVAVLGLAGVTTAVRHVALPVARRWTVRIGITASLFPTADDVFVLDRTPPARITAYRPTDGAVLWSASSAGRCPASTVCCRTTRLFWTTATCI
jgi:hypothetical protein